MAELTRTTVQRPNETQMAELTCEAGHNVVVKLTLIVNPMASSVKRRGLVVTQKRLAEEHELTVHETTRRNHATRLAHRAMQEGADVVATVGGDGTVNEAANGLIDTTCWLAPLPGGSTNVFARSIGYPNDLEAATEVLLQALANPEENVVRGSVGLANDRVFVFHVGAGFDAAVVHRVEARSPLKRLAGHPWFIASAIRTWSSTERKALALRVVADDGRTIDQAQMAVGMNVNPYTFLGNRPLDLAPEVTLSTPLSVVALDSMSLPNLASAVRSAFGSEGLANNGAQHHWTNVDAVTITSEHPFPFQLDGEPCEPVTTLRLQHRPDAVNFVVPKAKNS